MPLEPLGVPFVELQSVDSTNNYALGLLHEGRTGHGTAYFAHEQTMGKGQWGKTWTSGAGMNIMMSLVIKPFFLQPFRQFELSAALALACLDFFKKFAGDETSIKWPNDLYWKDRKAGGILLENVLSHGGVTWEWAVAGFGVNINQAIFSPELINPVSLKQITGKDHDAVKLAQALCERLDHYFKKLEVEGFAPILKEYNEVLYKKEQPVKFRKDNRVFEAIVKEVNSGGLLVVKHGIEEKFRVGEVEWVK